MNFIEMHPLYKRNNNIETGGTGINVPISSDTVTHITLEFIRLQNPDLFLHDLYGFEGKIKCNYKAAIVISGFQYFDLSVQENTDVTLSHLRVKNIEKEFKLHKIKVDRIDIEEASIIVRHCDIGEVYVRRPYNLKIETVEHKAKRKTHISIGNCRTKKLISYGEVSKIYIEESSFGRLGIQGDTEKLVISNYSEIGDLILSQNIGSLKLENSSVNFIQGTSSLLIQEFSSNYSNVSNVYSIFENNLVSTNEESYNLIRMSYRVRKDYNKYAHFSYLINKIYLKNEKRLGTKIPLALLNISCGFGYKLANTICFSAGIILIFSLFYFLLTCGSNTGLIIPNGYGVLDKALYSLYHSIITFSTLGYGDSIGQDWLTKFLSAVESLLGIYSMSIIVYTLTKKYSSFK